jgi:hypothetical protein
MHNSRLEILGPGEGVQELQGFRGCAACKVQVSLQGLCVHDSVEKSCSRFQSMFSVVGPQRGTPTAVRTMIHRRLWRHHGPNRPAELLVPSSGTRAGDYVRSTTATSQLGEPPCGVATATEAVEVADHPAVSRDTQRRSVRCLVDVRKPEVTTREDSAGRSVNYVG